MKKIERGPALWRAVMAAGVLPAMAPDLADRIRTSNGISALFFGISLFYALVFRLLGAPALGALAVLVGAVFLLFTLANSLGWNRFARLGLLLHFNVTVLFYSLALGQRMQIHSWFFVSAILPFLLFGLKDWRLAFSSGISVLGVLLASAGIELGLSPWLVLPEESRGVLELFMTPLAAAMTIYLAYYAVKKTARLEEEKAEPLRKMEVLVSSLQDMVFEISRDFRFLDAWTADSRQLLMPRDQFLGKTILETLPPEIGPQVQAAAEQALRSRKNVEFEFALSFHAYKWWRCRFNPRIGRDGAVEGLTALIGDVTAQVEERRRWEEEKLRLARATQSALVQAQAASEAKSLFLANVSHEIRTPLTAILGFSRLLIGEGNEEKRARYSAMIQKGGDLLLTVINDVLDLAKVEAGKLEISLRETRLADFVAETLALLEPQAREKGIRLAAELAGDLPEFVETDPARLRQVLINVIGNAVKFTARGSVKLQVGKEGAKLVFLVEDTGPGIPSEKIPDLFSPFSQVDARLRRKHGGTGLGLVIARKVARLLGGDTELVRSVPGEGSAFAVSVVMGGARGRFSRASAGEARAHVGKTLEGCRVLVVDDIPENLFLFGHFLEAEGAGVDRAASGREAIGLAGNRSYDAVLMDVQMPEMDGIETTAALRDLGYQGVIIACTAHAMLEEKEHFLRSGFDAFLGKPLDPEALVSLVRSAREGRVSQRLKSGTSAAPSGGPQGFPLGPEIRPSVP